MKHSILLPLSAYRALLGNNHEVADEEPWQVLEIDGPSEFVEADLGALQTGLLAAADVLVEDLAVTIKSKNIKQFIQASITLAAFTSLCHAIADEVAQTNPTYNIKAMEELNSIPKLAKPDTLLRHFHFFPLDGERSPLIDEADLAWYLDLYKNMMGLQANQIRQRKTNSDGENYPYGVNVFDAFSRFHEEIFASTPTLKEHDNSKAKITEATKAKITYKNCSHFYSPTTINCPLVIESLFPQICKPEPELELEPEPEPEPEPQPVNHYSLTLLSRSFVKKYIAANGNLAIDLSDNNSAQILHKIISQIITDRYTPTSPLGKKYLAERVTREIKKQFTYDVINDHISMSPQALAIGNVANYCQQLDALHSDITAYRDEYAAQNATEHQEVTANETSIQSKKNFSEELLECANNTNPATPVSITVKKIKEKLSTRKGLLAQQPKNPSQTAEYSLLYRLWEKANLALKNLYYFFKGDTIAKEACNTQAQDSTKSFYEAKLHCRLFSAEKTASAKPKPWLDPDKSRHYTFRRF